MNHTETAIADQAIRTASKHEETAILQSVVTFLDGLYQRGMVRFSLSGACVFEGDSNNEKETIKAFTAYFRVMERLRHDHPSAYNRLSQFILSYYCKKAQ